MQADEHEFYQARFPALRERVFQLLKTMPHCHGWDHTERVLRNARHLAQVEHARLAVVEYAALLHDIGRATEFADQGKTCHAQIGAELLPAILHEIGVENPEFIRHVTDCVLTHRYRKRQDRPPQTLEARIVFDADKLDSMGAIGLGRAFHFAGRVGARVHNTRQEALAAESYSEQDTAYREFLVKLQFLHDEMLTGEGRRMAEERHRFMTDFFARLNREVEGDDYPREG